MYLTKEVYVGSNSSSGDEVINFDGYGGYIEVPKKNIQSYKTEIMYWGKANAIHKWFVDNVQKGVDNCESYEVQSDQIIHLYELCARAYLTKDESLLIPNEGFFFGSTEVDERYWRDIFDTMESLKTIVDELKKEYNDRSPEYKVIGFYYRGSW